MLDKVEKATLLEEFKKLMPEFEFEFGMFVKNNDYEREAVFLKANNGMAAPLFYPADYQGFSFTEMAWKAKDLLNRFSIRQDEIKEKLLSPDYIKQNVRLQLLNTEKNRLYLNDKPAFKMGADLSAVLYIPLGGSGEAKGTVSKALIQDLNLDMEELKKLALKNMWENKEFQYMEVIAKRIVEGEENVMDGADTERILEELKSGTLEQMVVATNKERYAGSGTILCEEFCQNCNQDLVVLPSSIDEIILLPYHGEDLRLLQQIVEEVNRTQVKENEQLSDNVYLFDHETKTISLACDKYGLVPICDDTKLQLAEKMSITR